MKKAILITLCVAGLGCLVNAQQVQVSNEYLVNKFSLSPAYAGYTQGFEAFAGFRHNWLNITGSPVQKSINVNGSFLKNSGLGGAVIVSEAGIFNNLDASVTFAHHVKFSSAHTLHFGLSAGFLESHINISNNPQNQADIVVMNNQLLHNTMFNIKYGILYCYKKLSIGIFSPQFLESNTKDDKTNQQIYSLRRHYAGSLSYQFAVNKNILIEPVIVARATSVSGMFFEASVLAKYQETAWFGVIYRETGGLALNLGSFVHKKVLANYSYEFSSHGILSESAGTHEISIGFIIGKNKSKQSALFNTPTSPYQQWMND